MRKLLLIFLLVFTVVWGVSTLISLLASAKKPPLPTPLTAFSSTYNMEGQHKLLRDTQTQQKRIVDDQEFQYKQYRYMEGLPPSSDGRF